MRSALIRLLLVCVLAMGGVVAAPAQVACACSCAPLSTAEALASAAAVFDGEVVSASRPTTGFSGELLTYTIRVDRVFKGEVPALVVVRSEQSSATCGLALSGSVTVFAYGEASYLRTSLCSPPAKLDRSKLGAGKAPLPSASPTPAPEAAPASPIDTRTVVSVLVVLVVVGAGFVWMRRR